MLLEPSSSFMPIITNLLTEVLGGLILLFLADLINELSVQKKPMTVTLSNIF